MRLRRPELDPRAGDVKRATSVRAAPTIPSRREDSERLRSSIRFLGFRKARRRGRTTASCTGCREMRHFLTPRVLLVLSTSATERGSAASLGRPALLPDPAQLYIVMPSARPSAHEHQGKVLQTRGLTCAHRCTSLAVHTTLALLAKSSRTLNRLSTSSAYQTSLNKDGQRSLPAGKAKRCVRRT